MLLLAALGLIAGIAALQWGATIVCGFLGLVRDRFGLSQMGGGALVGLATASPEISVNVAAAALGWPGIGLGTALGSNIPTLPLIFVVGWLALRRQRRHAPESPASPSLPIKDEVQAVQTAPYLAVILLLATLTLPPAWAGLQPIDGLILLAAYGLFLAQATLRHRHLPVPVRIGWLRLLKLAWALATIAAGAIMAVVATNHINQMFGLPDVIGGLFLTGFLCALPETVSGARLIRCNQATAAVSAAVADGTASISLAFLPLAMIGAGVGDVRLYALNLGYLAVVLLLYLWLTRRSDRGADISPTKAAWIGGCYGGYLAAVASLYLLPGVTDR